MYTRYSILYIAPCSCRAPCSDSHLCASPSKPSPSVLGRSSPRVGFPALFEVSRVDTLLESRFLFDDVNFCHLLFSRGPGTAGRGGHTGAARALASSAQPGERLRGTGLRGRGTAPTRPSHPSRPSCPPCVPPPPARGLLCGTEPAVSGERKRTSCP